MIITLPKKPVDYSAEQDSRRMYEHAESQGEVLQFARRSSWRGKRVSGTVEGHGRSPRALSGVATTFKTGNTSEYQASPADSNLWASAHYRFHHKPYRNGPRLFAALFLVAMMFFRKGILK